MTVSFADVFKAIESLSKKQSEKDNSEVFHVELVPFSFLQLCTNILCCFCILM